MKEFFVN